MIVLFLFAALVAVSQGKAAPPQVKADLPSPVELFGLYRGNYHTFKTLTVQWQRNQVYTEAWRSREDMQLAAMERAIQAAEAAQSPNLHKLRQEVNAHQQKQMSRAGFLRVDQSYSTDRSRFLMKIAPVGWDSGAVGVRPVPGPAPTTKAAPVSRNTSPEPNPPTMPEDPITEESLKTIYGGYYLMAYPQPQRGGFLQVTVNNSPGNPVSPIVRRLNHFDGRNSFPPLGAQNPTWGQNTLHPIDEFFREKPEEFRSVGHETIGGRETILIERRRDVSPAGQPRQIEITRAWIDPAQGGLPLRIDWDTEPVTDGKPLPRDPNRIPTRQLEIDEVLAIPDAGFYPARGKISVFDTLNDSATGNLLAPRVLMEQTTWRVSLIRANNPLSATLTTIPIPKGTYYYDEVMGMSVRAGYEMGKEARLPWTLCGLLVAGWGLYGLIVLAWKFGAPKRRVRVA